MKQFLTFLFLAPVLWAQHAPNTVHVRGHVSLHPEVFSLLGTFTYTLENQSSLTQSSWALVVNGQVNILSIRQNDRDVEVLAHQQGENSLLSIVLSAPLKPQERTSVTVQFSLLPKKDDSRLSLGSWGAFLDARRLWFPIPEGDITAFYHIEAETPPHLYALMGARLISETSGPQGNFSVWESQLDNLGLSGTLIITDKMRYQVDDVYIYGTEQNAFIQPFLPYWQALRKDNPQFPLSQLHILPIDMNIPGKGDNFADGEFLGNLILIDQKLLQAARQSPLLPFAWAGNAQRRLTETLIHELFHAYLPGILSYRPEESVVMEGFVQYLTWSLIYSEDPLWGENISRRNRFLMLNLLTARDTKNPLWKYLLSSSLFSTVFESSSLRGGALANTLAEKYRFTPFSVADIMVTAEIHQTLTDDDSPIFPEFLQQFDRTFLYNTALQVFHTNLNGKDLSIVRARHTHSIPWEGEMSWVTDQQKEQTNSFMLSIPAGSTWITNIPGKVVYGALQSSMDYLEQFLGDNIFLTDDYGQKLTKALNEGTFFKEEFRRHNHIAVSDSALETLSRYREYNFTYLWDNSRENEVQVYLVDSKNVRRAFISLLIAERDGGIEIIRVLNPLEKRITDSLKK